MMIFNDEYINVKYDRFDLVSIFSTKEHAFILEYKENLNSFLVYVTTKEELFEALRNEDIGILKIINHNLKQYNLHSASNNIVTWLTEVRNFIRSNSIADDLVIFWDEFTSLLSISERKSIYSLTQDIAEISTTHDGGVYMFLITHISYESTDVYKDMSSNEKEHIRDRFIVLPYEIHYDTTYTILYSAMER